MRKTSGPISPKRRELPTLNKFGSLILNQPVCRLRTTIGSKLCTPPARFRYFLPLNTYLSKNDVKRVTMLSIFCCHTTERADGKWKAFGTGLPFRALPLVANTRCRRASMASHVTCTIYKYIGVCGLQRELASGYILPGHQTTPNDGTLVTRPLDHDSCKYAAFSQGSTWFTELK